jgi:hypothetical protein
MVQVVPRSSRTTRASQSAGSCSITHWPCQMTCDSCRLWSSWPSESASTTSSRRWTAQSTNTPSKYCTTPRWSSKSGTRTGISLSLSATRTLVRRVRQFCLWTHVERTFTAFYRQSLHIQHMHAELFHNANALRNINGFEDVVRMPTSQRALAVRSIRIARQCLEITLNSPAYREGMKYGTGAFDSVLDAAYTCDSRALYPCYRDVYRNSLTSPFPSFVSLCCTNSELVLNRLRSPEECSFEDARQTISRLAGLLSESAS